MEEGLRQLFSTIRITIVTVDWVILFLSGNSRSVIKENGTSLEDLLVKDVFILACVTFIFKGIPFFKGCINQSSSFPSSPIF